MTLARLFHATAMQARASGVRLETKAASAPVSVPESWLRALVLLQRSSLFTSSGSALAFAPRQQTCGDGLRTRRRTHGAARPDSVGFVASNEGLVSGTDALRRRGNAETGAPPTIGPRRFEMQTSAQLSGQQEIGQVQPCAGAPVHRPWLAVTDGKTSRPPGPRGRPCGSCIIGCIPIRSTVTLTTEPALQVWLGIQKGAQWKASIV